MLLKLFLSSSRFCLGAGRAEPRQATAPPSLISMPLFVCFCSGGWGGGGGRGWWVRGAVTGRCWALAINQLAARVKATLRIEDRGREPAQTQICPFPGDRWQIQGPRSAGTKGSHFVQAQGSISLGGHRPHCGLRQHLHWQHVLRDDGLFNAQNCFINEKQCFIKQTAAQFDFIAFRSAR